jgi:uncharacterized membrane protein YhaH (DUF805 family)
MEWMMLPFKKYAQFSGRSRRKEYWMWVLFIVIVSTVLRMIESLLGLGPIGGGLNSTYSAGVGGNGPLSGLFGLAVLVPGLAVAVRRLHDTNRSGWWMLALVGVAVAAIAAVVGVLFGAVGMTLVFVLVGGYVLAAIVLFVFMCLEGTRGPNRFGPDPKDPNGDLETVFS